MIYNIIQSSIYQVDTYLTKYNMIVIVIFKSTICILTISINTLIVTHTVSLNRTFPGISSFSFSSITRNAYCIKMPHPSARRT